MIVASLVFAVGAALLLTEAPSSGYLDIPQDRRVKKTSSRISPVSVRSQAAPPCPSDPNECQLPNCRCSSQDIPGSLPPSAVPQMILFTSDDAVTSTNYNIYQEVLANRLNPNGARCSATFYVSHEYTDYSLVHKLWESGFEIASHSITHQTGTDYWKGMNKTQMMKEAIDQTYILSNFANIPLEDIKGYRSPFLQMSGNEAYAALSEGGLEYECSRPTLSMRKPGLWPYTNDFLSTQDCVISPCADAAFPGFWTFPMIDLMSLGGYPCSMLDMCSPVPSTEEEMLTLLWNNFYDHYNGTRAPFPLYLHSAYLMNSSTEGAARLQGMKTFLDEVLTKPDVFMVSTSQALEWIKNPTPITEIGNFAPWQDQVRDQTCATPRTCELKFQDSIRYMRCCTTCPDKYPWLGNPMGTS